MTKSCRTKHPNQFDGLIYKLSTAPTDYGELPTFLCAFEWCPLRPLPVFAACCFLLCILTWVPFISPKFKIVFDLAIRRLENDRCASRNCVDSLHTCLGG